MIQTEEEFNVKPSVEEIAKEIVNVFRKDGGIIDHENIEGVRGFMWERIAEALRNERNRHG